MESVLRRLTKHFRLFIKKSYMRLCNKLFSKPNKIVFENFGGRGYGDNPKYIAKEIIQRELKYDLVWIIDGKHDYKFPPQIRTVKSNTLRELYELATARIWIDNNRKGANIVKSKYQYYIQTWHGFYPLKKLEKDAEESLTNEYVAAAINDARNTDLMISGCKVRSELYKSAFWYNGEILECGSPRNDILFSGINIKKIYKSLQISEDIKTVLYAPTFRDDHSIVAYNIDYEVLVESLKEKFGGQWMVLLKLHPAVRESSMELNLTKDCLDVSAYDDIQELFCVADIMISDYSDVMFEYSLTRKPVFIYASDLNEYSKGRSFYYDIHELPYDIASDNGELKAAIQSFEYDKYIQKMEAFLNNIGSFENGTASKAIVDIITEIIGR